ncbi:Glutathione S-transferase-like protein 11 [Elsinoe fawcettii]|nr:Glutathione S-transferase-like protein 11 [Elsinoe fawcettii]
MGEEIILYDLPSRQGTSWSLNPWKTRMILNYKGINYKTQWIEYPDVAPLLKSFGLPPNEEGTPYTIPTIKTKDGEYIMDSKKIAAYLEKTYPPGEYPEVKLDTPVQERVINIIQEIMTKLAPVVMPKASRNLLNPPSQEYFQRTRAERFGMSLDELEAKKGGDESWKDAEKPLNEMAALLQEKDGPYCLGDKSCYADFYIVTSLHFMKRVDENIYNRIVKDHVEFRSLYTCMQAYLDKED